MEGNGMFLLLFVFVCQGVLGVQMKVFCLFGWGMVGWCELFQGKMMAFLDVFGVFALLVGGLKRTVGG